MQRPEVPLQKKKKCKWMGSAQTIFRESSVQDLHRIFAVHLFKKKYILLNR